MQYFSVVLFTILYKVFLTFWTMSEIYASGHEDSM